MKHHITKKPAVLLETLQPEVFRDCHRPAARSDPVRERLATGVRHARHMLDLGDPKALGGLDVNDDVLLLVVDALPGKYVGRQVCCFRAACFDEARCAKTTNLPKQEYALTASNFAMAAFKLPLANLPLGRRREISSGVGGSRKSFSFGIVF